jgi:ribonuclease HI
VIGGVAMAYTYKLKLYVDGSWAKEENNYTWAFIAVKGRKCIHQSSGMGTNDKARKMKHVAGELSAAMRAVKWAVDNGYEKFELYYDFEGIELLTHVQGNRIFTRKYHQFISKYLDRITFVKVKSHVEDKDETKYKWNNMVDKLASSVCSDDSVKIPW